MKHVTTAMNLATGGSSELDFFSQQKGTTVTLIRGTVTTSISKTERDTNLSNASVVPAKMFKIMGLSIYYVHATHTSATNANDRNIVRGNSYIKFKVIDKDILTVPVISIPELNPICSLSTTVNATSVYGEVGGGGPMVGMYRFPVPLVLMPYENFDFRQIRRPYLVTNTETHRKFGGSPDRIIPIQALEQIAA